MNKYELHEFSSGDLNETGNIKEYFANSITEAMNLAIIEISRLNPIIIGKTGRTIIGKYYSYAMIPSVKSR